MSALKEAIPSDDYKAVADAIAGIGHNQAPEPTPFDLSEQEISDLYEEAKHWLDGDPVTTQAQCDAISKLMDDLRKAAKIADDRRTEENIPFDEGKKAVQAKYAPLIADTKQVKGKSVLAIDACKKAMAPFLLAEDARKRAIAEAARKEAEEKAAKAQAAILAVALDDLAAREAAEAQLQDAKRAETTAKRAENDKAQAKGGSRATSLRTTFEHEITDMREFARWCWAERRPEMDEFFNAQAKTIVAYGKRDIPGVTVHERRSVV